MYSYSGILFSNVKKLLISPTTWVNPKEASHGRMYTDGSIHTKFQPGPDDHRVKNVRKWLPGRRKDIDGKEAWGNFLRWRKCTISHSQWFCTIVKIYLIEHWGFCHMQITPQRKGESLSVKTPSWLAGSELSTRRASLLPPVSTAAHLLPISLWLAPSLFGSVNTFNQGTLIFYRPESYSVFLRWFFTSPFWLWGYMSSPW